VPYLRLLVDALSRLPRYSLSIWRGLRGVLHQNYPQGQIVTWWSFSSCTRDMKILDNFTGGKGYRTIFKIERHDGVEISHFSSYGSEAEILLLPGFTMRVRGMLQVGDGVHIIDLYGVENQNNLLTYTGNSMPRQPPAPRQPPPRTSDVELSTQRSFNMGQFVNDPQPMNQASLPLIPQHQRTYKSSSRIVQRPQETPPWYNPIHRRFIALFYLLIVANYIEYIIYNPISEPIISAFILSGLLLLLSLLGPTLNYFVPDLLLSFGLCYATVRPSDNSDDDLHDKGDLIYNAMMTAWITAGLTLLTTIFQCCTSGSRKASNFYCAFLGIILCFLALWLNLLNNKF